MEDILVPIAFFLLIGFAVFARHYYSFRVSREQQATVRELLSKGQNVSPEVLETLLESLLPSPQADLRRGVVGIGLGLALVIFGFVLDEPDAQRPLMGLAAFPGLVGIAYLLLFRFGGTRDASRPQPQ